MTSMMLNIQKQQEQTQLTQKLQMIKRRHSNSFTSGSTVLLESSEEQSESILLPAGMIQPNEEENFKLPTFSSQLSSYSHSTKASTSTPNSYFPKFILSQSPSLNKKIEQYQKEKSADYQQMTHEDLLKHVIELQQTNERQKNELSELKNTSISKIRSSSSKSGQNTSEESVINQLRIDKERLVDMNQRTMKSNDTLQRENRTLKQNHEQLKSLYKQLRIDFQAAIHKQQELYLQLNSEKSKGILNNKVPAVTAKAAGYQNAQSTLYNSDGKPHVSDENLNTSNILCSNNKQSQSFMKSVSKKTNSDTSSTIAVGSSKCSSSVKKPLESTAQSSMTLAKLQSIYGVEGEEELIDCAMKTKVVVEAVPRLEALIEEITDVLFEKEKAQKSAVVGEFAVGFDEIIPRIRQWQNEIKCIDRFLEFKDEMCLLLRISKEQSSDRDILAAIQEILSNRIGYDVIPSFAPQINNTKTQALILESLKALGVQINCENVAAAATAKVSQINSQLNDVKRFLKGARVLLNLRTDTPQEITFTSVLKYLENSLHRNFD